MIHNLLDPIKHGQMLSKISFIHQIFTYTSWSLIEYEMKAIYWLFMHISVDTLD